ncbi:MAG TPA: hypothetical protein VEL75_11745 [Candidatus Methylomirabilis sp.]|nr:hypothetical protein [Candidatus Methylomirabilis sp.]
MRAVLAETVQLFSSHLHLFTLISLSVWLPGHVLRNYIEFFGPPDESGASSLPVMVAVQTVFDPLVVAGTLAALARIKQGRPVGYVIAMLEGVGAWGRLVMVRLIIDCAVAVPALGGLAIPLSSPARILAAGLLEAIALSVLVLLVRFAVVDAVVVLEGANAVTAWRRAAHLTAGRRLSILAVAVAIFVPISAAAVLAGWVFKASPELNHFVVRVLVDCALAVAQSLFTIAFFVFYWRARTAPAPA